MVSLPLTGFDFQQKSRDSFAMSELGRIYAQLPPKLTLLTVLFLYLCAAKEYRLQ